MKNDRVLKAYVSEASDLLISVKVFDKNFLKELFDLGFSIRYEQNFTEMRILTEDVRKKASILSALRDDGVCFSIGSGWSPASVFEYLREKV